MRLAARGPWGGLSGGGWGISPPEAKIWTCCRKFTRKVRLFRCRHENRDYVDIILSYSGYSLLHAFVTRQKTC